MTGPAPTRREENRRKRQSRRPSRLGTAAGAAPTPDYLLADDAGFPGLLDRARRRAAQADGVAAKLAVLLTLDGHVPADVQLRALGPEAEAAVFALCGATWREQDGAWSAVSDAEPADTDPAAGFLGEIGLTAQGRVAVRVPSGPALDTAEKLVGAAIRVRWSERALSAYHRYREQATKQAAANEADCRRWLAELGADGRDELLRDLERAALRTAPFMFYQGARQYSNLRDGITLTGKTLWPGHPDCALSVLERVPLELWSAEDATMVVCLALLVRSAGYARIEEANGTQLTLDHVGHLLEQARRRYNAVPGAAQIPSAAGPAVEQIGVLADALRQGRTALPSGAQLYREIHGVLMHKIERVAAPPGPLARSRESEVCAQLSGTLPLSGASFEALGDALEARPDWLAEPHGDFGTGLESLVYQVVTAANRAFRADFTMSRGMRSLPQLVSALREDDWTRMVGWDITRYFCCVVAAPEAARFFDGSPDRLADTMWAISSRMQYNSWHFLAGNLPRVPQVERRDYFVPPTIPDIAFYSDQHHYGHVASRVRYSIRSPHQVRVLDRPFNGFVDLRLLRCEGPAFEEQDVLAARGVSTLVARATTLAAALVADGRELEVTAFDSDWHARQARMLDPVAPAAEAASAAATAGEPR